MNNAEMKYRELKDKYQEKIRIQTTIINTVSNLRLLAFLVAIALGLYFVVNKDFVKLAMDIGIFILVFIPLVLVHDVFMQKRRYSLSFFKINKVSLMRIQGEWNGFIDIGEEFIDETHSFSQDLDIFGEGSLFQYINTAVTFLGRHKLKDLLTKNPENEESIVNRREAVFELSEKLDWRQHFQAEGRLEADKMHDPKELFDWAKEKSDFYRNQVTSLVFYLIPMITLAIGIFTFMQPVRNYYFLIGALLIQAIIVYGKFRKRAEILDTTSKYMRNIKVYYELLACFENEHFNSKHLNYLKTKLKNSSRLTASAQIKKLVRLVDFISNRNSEIYVIFNVLFMLDFHFMFALERWKAKYGVNLAVWLDTVAEVEALNSLSILRHDNPEWATPEIIKGDPAFKAEKMGHPLLIEKCVKNDLVFGEKDSVLLITGSNMSGKSTLLRTAGINLVLAYAGAPVCASVFKCSVMEVFSCMRVHDNLEKNISSFYAELIRIKKLVEAVESGKHLFFLLDEIFKGTNSKDRHTGARMLIKKLSMEKVLGLVSTHDLELCDLDFEIDKVKNYHFQEYYKNNEIMFDYLLREGISKTQNAEYLMKMAGIEFDKR